MLALVQTTVGTGEEEGYTSPTRPSARKLMLLLARLLLQIPATPITQVWNEMATVTHASMVKEAEDLKQPDNLRQLEMLVGYRTGGLLVWWAAGLVGWWAAGLPVWWAAGLRRRSISLEIF